jgi:hypothetical protein
VAVAQAPTTEMCGCDAKVMDGKSAAVDVGSKLSIRDAGANRHRSGFCVEFDLVEMF